jgi:hypothetical protein
MYATIDPNGPLSHVVGVAANAEDLFEEEGIDYWFGWTRPLRAACEVAHVCPEDIAFRLLARDRGLKDPAKESLVTLLSDLDQHFDLRLEPALVKARNAAAKLEKGARARCSSTIDTIDRVIQTHEATVRCTLGPIAAALDVGAEVNVDEKIVRHLAMDHSILALRANDLRADADQSQGTEFEAAARTLIREIHQHIKVSYNFILPRLVAAGRPAAGHEAW